MGALRHTSNVAFVVLVKNHKAAGKQKAVCWATKQVGYILGDTGFSYLVGYGTNYPRQPHHRAASCPNPPAVCDWAAFNSPSPNPQVIQGALVGGPDASDKYQDSRSAYVYSEVAVDYNAGFTGAVAALNMYRC